MALICLFLSRRVSTVRPPSLPIHPPTSLSLSIFSLCLTTSQSFSLASLTRALYLFLSLPLPFAPSPSCYATSRAVVFPLGTLASQTSRDRRPCVHSRTRLVVVEAHRKRETAEFTCHAPPHRPSVDFRVGLCYGVASNPLTRSLLDVSRAASLLRYPRTPPTAVSSDRRPLVRFAFRCERKTERKRERERVSACEGRERRIERVRG